MVTTFYFFTLYSLHKVEPYRKGTHRHDRKQCRQDEVVSNRRYDTEQFHWRAYQHKSVVVIIDVSARKPGVVWREGGGFQHCIEIRKIHWTLAALGRMPQVRVAQADE